LLTNNVSHKKAFRLNDLKAFLFEIWTLARGFSGRRLYMKEDVAELKS
jgi:hypothetical protein